MSTPQIEANKDGAASGLALATGSALYVTDFHRPDCDPKWVTRIHHGPYVAYHYTREAADQLTDMLNERTRLRSALVQIEGNDRHWNELWAAKVAAEALSQNVADDARREGSA